MLKQFLEIPARNLITSLSVASVGRELAAEVVNSELSSNNFKLPTNERTTIDGISPRNTP